MKRYLGIGFFMLVAACGTQAQSLERNVVGSAGGVQSAGGNELSFTVGESVVATFSNATLTITQGFQQANEKKDGGGETGVQENLTYTLNLFPNPTQDEVRIISAESKAFNLRVFDAAGKEVLTQELNLNSQSETFITVREWATGTYHFQFIDQEGRTEDFKLLKQ